MEAAYFKAAIPEPFRILGLRLKPLSLGRYRLMQRFGCAFVSEEKVTPTLNDLVLGVLICSMSCKETARFFASADLTAEVERWGKTLGPFEPEEKFKLFADYIRAGSEPPQYWSSTEGGGSGGGHWSQSVEVVLRGQLGWSGLEIAEEPLSKALSDYFKWAETQGLIQLMTSEEIKYLEEQGAASGS